MITNACPTQEEIRNYLLGKASATSEMIAHLQACSQCERVAEQLDTEHDTIVDRLRVDLEAEFPDITDLSNTELGDYRLIQRIGAGGMGTVYKGMHKHLKKLVAIKILPKERTQSTSALRRFRTEMEAAARVDHAHVVRAMDAREVSEIHFLVMEYVDGVNLSQLVSNVGVLPVAAACEFIRQAAIGMESIHAAGMVHRDLKPSNLLLSSNGTLKVADLGLAYLTEDEATWQFDTIDCYDTETIDDEQSTARTTRTGHRLGTLKYAAPEQAIGTRDVDYRADIFSLGCTLYYLLAGTTPYLESWTAETAANTRSPSLPKATDRRIPKALNQLVTQMIAPATSNRTITMREVSNRLESLVLLSGRAQLDQSLAPSIDAGFSQLIDQVLQRQRAWKRRWITRALTSVAAVALIAGLLYMSALRNNKAELPAAAGVEPVVENTISTDQRDLAPPDKPKITALELAVKEGLIIENCSFTPSLGNLVIWGRNQSSVWKTGSGERESDWLESIVGKTVQDAVRRYAMEQPRTSDLPTFDVCRFDSACTSYTGAFNNDHFYCVFPDKSEGWIQATEFGINDVAISHNGNMLAVAGEGRLEVWSTQSRKRDFEVEVPPINCFAISADGEYIAWALKSGGVSLLSRTSGDSKFFDLGSIHALAFVPNGLGIISASSTGSIKVVDFKQRLSWKLGQLTLEKDESFLRLATNHAAETLVVATNLGRIHHMFLQLHLVDMAIPESRDAEPLTLSRILDGATSRATSVAFNEGGRQIAVGSDDLAVRIYDVTSGSIHVTDTSHQTYVRSVRFLADGRLLVSASEDGIVHVSRFPEMELQSTIRVDGVPTTIASWPNRDTLAIGAGTGKVFWASTDSNNFATLLCQADERTLEPPVCISSNDKMFVGSKEGQVFVFDGNSGSLITKLQSQSETSIFSLSISGDGQQLVSGSGDGMLQLWDTSSLESVRRWRGHYVAITGVEFSPDDEFIASVCRRGELKTWKTETVQLTSSQIAHRATIRDVEYSPNGEFIATASHDYTVKLWKTSSGD